MLITVTGGAGFIGRNLVDRLLGEGHCVRVLDDFSTGRRENVPTGHPRLSLVEGCTSDERAVGAAARGADLIFHLASLVGQVSVSRDPERSRRISEQGLRALNAAAAETPLVLFSSSAVYGLGGDEPCREGAPAAAEAARAYDGGVEGYAFGKWLAESLAAERASPLLIVRPFNVIGPGQVGTYGMVVPRFVRSALAGEPVTIYGSGLQTRSFGDVGAFVGHLLALVAAWREGRTAHSTYNIGTRAETSIEDVIETVDRVLGTRTERRYLPYELAYPGKRDVQRRRPCLERIEAVLGPLDWPPLERTIRDIAEQAWRGDGYASRPGHRLGGLALAS